MIIKDSAALVRQAFQTEQERVEHEMAAAAQRLAETSRLLDDPGLDPGNAERQMGRSLPHEVIERRLRRLNDNLRFSPWVSSTGVFNPTKRIVDFLEPTGELDRICIMEAGLTPENSIMSYEYVVTLTKEAMNPGFLVDRKDMPKTEIIQPHQDANGQWWTGDVQWDPGTLLPGQQVIKVPRSEIKRGYRTVGNILIQRAIITLEGFEREFGTQNKASWAAASGRRKKETPW